MNRRIWSRCHQSWRCSEDRGASGFATSGNRSGFVVDEDAATQFFKHLPADVHFRPVACICPSSEDFCKAGSGTRAVNACYLCRLSIAGMLITHLDPFFNADLRGVRDVPAPGELVGNSSTANRTTLRRDACARTLSVAFSLEKT